MRKLLLYQLKLIAKENLIILFLGLLILMSAQRSEAQTQTFTHPGIPFTQADLNQLKANITKEPWLSAYNAFKNDSRSKLSYGMQGPHATVSRAPNLNNTQWKSDMQAIHNLAFMYVFTGDSAYARKATNMLDAWAVTNTVWGGNESMLDIGDYAQYWGTAAEILRYTFPGWTAANTQHVEKYFSQVLFPTSWVPYPLRDQNKGAIQLKIAFAASVFCNDINRFNQTVEVYRMDAGGGMRNSLPNGEVGDTGRDDHWRVQVAALAWGAEVAWKQGIDMFAELDNRVLATAELYHQYAFDGATMTYIPFGGYASYWTNWGIAPGARVGDMSNIIYSAYKLRKGIPTPHTDRMRAALGGAGGDFLFLKSSDSSTAVSLTPVHYPADHVQPVSNLTHIDIGNPGLAGSSSFNNGIWTLKGAGTSTSNAFSFNFKKVSGDAGLVVKVNSVSPLSGGCGVMFRESLAPGSRFWDLYLGANGGAARHWQPKAPWWLKIERVGTRIFMYHSQDGVNWTNTGCAYSETGFPTELYAGFYTMSGNASALNTAIFSNVAYSQTAPTGSPEISSATTATTTIGTSFTYTIGASANPTAYSASGLPAGLSLDATTGVISGTPTELGQSEVTLAATNASGTGTATLILKVADAQAPAAPAGVTAAINNITRINIAWPAVANATTYTVKRSLTSGGPYTAVQSGITGTSYIDVAPEPEVNNYYVVTALAGDLESGISNEVFAAVPPGVPGKPVAVNGEQQISLSWEPASGANTYNVKRSASMGGPYTTIASVATTSYTDLNLTNGTAYYYVVSSMGNTKESGNSPEAFGVPGSSSLTWSADPSTDSLNYASNWLENKLPVNPVILTFGASADTVLTNDITGLEVSRMLFDAAANPYTIGGNSITLKSDVVNNSTKAQRITAPVVLSSELNVNTNTQDIYLSGGITGTGRLLKTGYGLLFISGANTYTGGTTINGNTGGWGPKNGIGIAGTGTGTPSAPTSGPLGTGKIIMNGGALYSEWGDATLYNDIEVTAGKRSYMYETSYALILRGKLTGTGTLEHDGNTYAGFHLYGDNSEFAGTFISKLRSGNQRVRFQVPQSGSAKAHWLLDANGVDCHSIQFSSGTLHFGGLSGRGYLRNNAGGSPVISIGALNTNTNFSGTFANFLNIEKVGTGTLMFSGNHTYGGTTTIKKGKFLLSNNPSSGTFPSPVIVEEGAFGGTGKGTGSVNIGTGNGPGAVLEPGNDAVGSLFIGALTLKADATYKAELNLGTAAGDKVTTPAVTLLNSPILSLSSIAGTLPSGTAYTIIDNTGSTAIAGTFKDLPEMSLVSTGGYDFRITYKGGTGNDVILMDDRTMPVVITSAAADTALIDRPFTYTITGIKSPNSFTATGLPAGLSINTATGVISGTPTEFGTFPVAITATNGSTTGTQTFALLVQNTVVGGVMVASGDAKTTVEWDVIPGFSYNVKRSTTPGGTYTTIGNVSTTKFTDTNVTNGSTYYYVVSSVDSVGENPNSTEVVARPTAGQIAYLKFDEQSGTRAIDNWGATHGTLQTTATRSEGRNGQALKLNGTATAYATLPADIVSTLSDYTISSWIKMDALANWMRVFDFGRGTSNYMFLSAQAGAAGQVRFAVKNGGSSDVGITYNYAVPLNTWTHFAITQSGNICSMYINGALVATNTNLTIKPSTIGSMNQNYLGKSQWPDPMFKGAIDEFKIYSRALSAAEIAGTYTSQTITFNAIASKLMGDEDVDPAATASSGLPVTYTSSDTTVAKIVDGKVRILSTGTSTITASQAGNNSYWPAASQSKVLSVAITANTQLTTLIGKPFTYTITSKPLSNFTATGLPAGLSVNAATGVISGTPTEFGVFPVTIGASNGTSTGSQTITLTVQNSVISNVIVAAGDAKNIIEWDPIQNFTYNVKRSTVSGGPYTTIANVSTTKFTDTNVSNGTIYYYVVASVDSTGENSSSTEVSATPNAGQLVYLKFDETNGTRAIDTWGATHGTLAATASRNTGKSGQGLKLDGTANSYAFLPSNVVSTLSNYTISSWVKMDALANWMRVFDFGTGTSKYLFLSVQTGTAGQVRFAIKNGGSEQGMTYNYAVPLNTWTHFAITQSGNTCSMYINGALVATNTAVSIKPSTIGSMNQNYLGKSQWPDPMFKGSIDEFKIYNRALSAAEIVEGMKSTQTIKFNALAEKGLGEADFDAAATASSGLPVTYTSSDTSVATIVGGKVHILATGTSTITASQAGSANYTAAPPVARVLTVKKVQAINFAAIGTKTLGDADFDAAATASSGLSLTYSSSNPAVATIVDGKVHLIGAGTSTITASQAGNAEYLAASSTQALTVNKKAQSITFAALEAKTLGDADFNAGATASSGLTVTYASSDTTVATIVAGKVQIISAGTTTITASQAGNAEYLAASSVTQTLTVNKKAQSITFAALEPKTLGDDDFDAGATASSELALVYTSSDTTVAEIVDGKVHVIAAGTTTITASQEGNEEFNAASSVTQTLTVNKKEQSITFAALEPKTLGDADFDAAATASSGLAVSYNSSNGNVATIVDGKVHIIGAGTTTITATQAGDTEYNAASSVSQTLTVNKKEQSIAFATLQQKTLGDADFDAAATASSGLVISYTSSNTAVATIVNGNIHIVGAGTATITASQAGSAEYNAANLVSQELTVVKKDQTISFAAIAEKTTRDADFDPAAVASSALPVTYTSSNESVATIVNGKVHLVGGGTTVITASQAGDASFNAASSVSQELNVFVPPAVFTKNIAVELNASGIASITAADVDNGSISYSGALSLALDQSTFGCSNVGTPVTVTLTGTDAKGYASSTTAQVTVTDHVNPVVTAPASQAFCYAGSTYSLPSLVASDNCGVASIAYTISGATQRSGSGADASGTFNPGVSTISWTVTDIHGNTATASSTVSVNSALTSSIADVYALNSYTDDKNTIYLGYGPSSLTVNATVNGGTAPYTYAWSTGASSQSISVSAEGTYIVTITDAKGCQTTSSIVINVLDVRCGNNNDKVQICHNGNLICVASSSVQAHLDHGDKLGSCNSGISIIPAKLDLESPAVYSVKLYPNPVSDVLNIKVTELEAGATVKVYDMAGMEVISQRLTETPQAVNVSNLKPGIYVITIINGTHVTREKFIKK